MNAGSLRRRLLLAGTLGVALAAGCAAWLLGAAFERAAQREFDRRLEVDLDKLIALVEVAPDGRPRLMREPAEERYDRIFSGAYWAVRLGDETRASRSAWDSATLDAMLAVASALRGSRDIHGPRGQRLRTLSQRVRFEGGGEEAVFAVAEDTAPLRREARDFRLFAGLAVAGIAAALLLAMAAQVAWGLRPLRRIGDVLRRLRAGEDVRFGAQTLPSEVAPLAAQVDDLLDEHMRRVERARHAAQDLAHALKTPLAALLLDGERAVPDLPARAVQHARRMQEIVSRRLAGGFAADTRERTPVREVLLALSSVLQRVHPALDVQVDAGASLLFAGRIEDLEEMLGNLLDNACRFALRRVRAVALEHEGQLHIEIEDDGLGLAPDQIARVVQRGVRLDEREEGSGLGLAIVQDLAASHGGWLDLIPSAWGGLLARLRFPAAGT